MLRFAEEIMLLLLDDQDGSFLPIPEWSMQCALAGAVLMDLALEDRIDTDLDSLILVDKAPTGDPLLDPTLERIAAGVRGRSRRPATGLKAQPPTPTKSVRARLPGSLRTAF